jgi:GNAT superfamily N-acetyltransferase
MNTKVVVLEEESPAERDAILQRLLAFNRQIAPSTEFLPLGLLLKDQRGETIGGFWGHSVYDWLYVETLFVPQALRGSGVGTSLMRQAENIARERRCTGVWLDTFVPQARTFYLKLGYSVFGELKDHPSGISQYWLQKRLVNSTAE